MDMTMIFSQITPTTLAIVTGLAVMGLLIIYRRSIKNALSATRKHILTRTGFFWAVQFVFMAVSVLHAGAFFGITGNGHDLPGLGQFLGFAVSFFLDLVTIILMQAMLEARYRGETPQARQFLFFIAICCFMSTFANLAISLNDFNASSMLPHAPSVIQTLSPFVLASFPLLIIMTSIAAEKIVNVKPLDNLNEEDFESEERKRVALLSIRNTYLRKQADEELIAMTIRAQMQANKARFRQPLLTPLHKHQQAQISHYKQQILDLELQLKALALQTQPASIQDTEPLSIPANEASTDEVSHELSPDVVELLREHYPAVYTWIENKIPSVTKQELTDATGFNYQKINANIGKQLKITTRNKNRVLVSSVVAWLSSLPVPIHSAEVPVNMNGHKTARPEDTLVEMSV
jgi:hypothetical protein